jgi:hypothetical protein
MFGGLSLFTGKAPLDGQSDKKSWTLQLDWKTGGLDENSPKHFFAP